MFRLICVFALVLVAVAPVAAEEPKAQAFEKDLTKAFAKARETGKPVFLYVHDSV